MRIMLAGSLKTIGQDMAVDLGFAPDTIVRLKLQGVGQFGDFAIQIRMTMLTRPGEQFVIRRKAYARIKQGFNANGIRRSRQCMWPAAGMRGSPSRIRACNSPSRQDRRSRP